MKINNIAIKYCFSNECYMYGTIKNKIIGEVMKSIRLIIAILAASSIIHAGEVDGNAVLGGALGAAAGSAVGSAIGGKEGAIIGAGAGGAVGAAIASDREPRRDNRARVIERERVIVRDRGDNPNVHYDQGKHKGHYKKKHKKKYKYENDRDRDYYRDYDRNRERHYENDRFRGRDW